MHTQFCSTSEPWKRKQLHNLKDCLQGSGWQNAFVLHSCKMWLLGKLFRKSAIFKILYNYYRGLQKKQWLNSDFFSTDRSHINLPPLTHVELFSAVFTLPLSLTSALRVISSAIWSIASQIKNSLRMTNLITSSQKYRAACNWSQLESMSNTALP